MSITLTTSKASYSLVLEIVLQLVDTTGTDNNPIAGLQLTVMLKPTISSFGHGNPLLVLLFKLINDAPCTRFLEAHKHNFQLSQDRQKRAVFPLQETCEVGHFWIPSIGVHVRF